MKIVFLGTGTSTGNPEIGCRCEVCTSTDRRDWRLRTSLLVETDGCRILLDCGPDFRWQILRSGVTSLDAVVLSHEHYDHVGGLDDLRPFTKDHDLHVYAETYVADAIRNRIPYVFRENKYPGVPNLVLNPIQNKPFFVQSVRVIPIRLMHGRLPIFGYRIGNMAYLPDFISIPEEEYEKLKNLDVLVVDALRDKEHISHETVGQALQQIERIQAQRSYLIHMSHQFGLHAEREKLLPENVFISYDGLEVEVKTVNLFQ